MTTGARRACPVCGGASGAPLLEWRNLPVFCNVLAPTATEAAAAATADIVLVQCAECTLVYNAAFDERLVEYAPGYENALHHSAVFRQYSEELVDRLVREHDLDQGLVVEVGSGGGSFLRDLCRSAGARGMGFDPSRPADEVGDEVVLRAAPFPTDGAIDADLIVSRHVFEHLPEPTVVMAAIASALRRRPSAACYVEVPDGDYMLRATALWDVIYEHCSYFTAHALGRLVTGSGLTVTRAESAFGGQYLWVEAAATGAAVPTLADRPATAASGEEFRKRVGSIVASWRALVSELASRGRVVIWGAGSKGVTFVNLMPKDAVDAVVDLNPLKHGRFTPVTGHRVVAPHDLLQLDPTTVIVMNPIYRDEVSLRLRDLGLAAEVVVAG